MDHFEIAVNFMMNLYTQALAPPKLRASSVIIDEVSAGRSFLGDRTPKVSIDQSF